MSTRLGLLATMVVALGAPVVAQSISSPVPAPRLVASTPAECTKGATDWRAGELAGALAELRSAQTAEQSKAASSKYSALYGVVMNESRRAARECASRFDVETVASAQLFDLAALYAYTGDTTNNHRATERALAATDLAPRQRGQALLLAMGQEITRGADQFAINAGAERYVARIDQLPDSLADVKFTAHQRMLGQYEYLDVDDGLRLHAAAVITLARRFGNMTSLASGYLSLARAAADYMHPDSALAILTEAEKEIGPAGAAMFKDFRDRYALIGTPAAAVTGAFWLNAPGTPAPVQPGHGRVTLVEFTAHWCKPCKNSYPGMRSLAEKFRGKPFEAVLVTSLYGYLGDQRNLTPEQEVEADRVYFTQEHALPYKVAINPPPMDRREQPQVDKDYRVGGIPQLVLIDKHGVIRQIVTGWDRGNTERFSKLIERLLNEPTA